MTWSEPDLGWESGAMSIFRCYALDERERIVAREDIECIDLAAATQAGWAFVTARPSEAERKGLEIWCGRTLLFSTKSPASPVPGQHAPDHQAFAA